MYTLTFETFLLVYIKNTQIGYLFLSFLLIAFMKSPLKNLDRTIPKKLDTIIFLNEI